MTLDLALPNTLRTTETDSHLHARSRGMETLTGPPRARWLVSRPVPELMWADSRLSGRHPTRSMRTAREQTQQELPSGISLVSLRTLVVTLARKACRPRRKATRCVIPAGTLCGRPATAHPAKAVIKTTFESSALLAVRSRDVPEDGPGSKLCVALGLALADRPRPRPPRLLMASVMAR